MRKTVIILTLLVLCLTSIKLPFAHAEMECTTIQKDMTVLINTRQVYKDGKVYLSKEKHEVKKGVTYIPLRTLAENLGYTLSYNKANKQTYITNGEDTFRFGINTGVFVKNLEVIKYKSGTSYTENGTLMVPVRDVASALGLKFSANVAKKRIILSWEEIDCYQPNQKSSIQVGEKYPIDRDEVLEYPIVSSINDFNGGTLIRSNSPERIVREGIHYIDQIDGFVRFIIHKQNAVNKPVKIYLLAQNNNNYPVNIELNSLGIGGPSQYVSTSGRSAVANYLTSFKQGKTIFSKTLQPGEQAIVIPEMSKNSLKQNQTMTVYADLFSSDTVEYKIIALFEETDLFTTLPHLKGDYYVGRDGVHTRGTFPHSDKTITVNELVGDTKSRIILGDGKEDPYVVGIDKTRDKEETNSGNRGVLYDITLNNVAPNSIIALNPRGGHYAGAFLVNNKVILAPTSGVISGPSEQLVLHKTGEYQERVNIKFIPASGSNLPLSLLFLPDEN